VSAPELYHNDKSTCSQKVRLVLAENNIAYKDRHIDLSAEENLSAAYLAINPNGVVPALVHDGVTIIESTVICEYLCEVFPDGAGLMPRTPAGRAYLRAWLRYIDEVPSMAVRVPTFEVIKAARFAAMSDAEYEAFANRNPLRRDFFERLARTGFSERDKASAEKQLTQTVQRMERALSDVEYLVDGAYSLADICLFPVFQRLDDLGVTWPFERSAATVAWYERIKARPAYAQAFYSGSLFFDPPRVAA